MSTWSMNKGFFDAISPLTTPSLVRFRRVRAFRQMEAPGGHLDSFRAASGNSSSRRYGMLSASNIIQAPLSALLEYSGLLRGRSNHQEAESLINGRSAAAFRDHHRSQLDQSPTTSNDGEVSIRIIGAGEQEHDREARRVSSWTVEGSNCSPK
ncbi:RING finger and transmembrane domain-containing protein 1 [Prunus yedoensis var. nudiflora]|uniref:RING finger and transmembrane domain-containing protein 1 n=1 Tax=Prunus yedoensis var. nudiflora TaxID=2094558 RepID=A0A314YRQ9_PRUYE|nr:RING finger and transmembrane domain-containing protein 1 [Prunus yedoensis var. nudiflora]